LLVAARLVTLTGFGGVGKTRLALQVAAEVRRSFPDGVWLVELAGLHDASLVPHAVSRALRIPDRSSGDQAEALIRFLADRRLLLVLDNCEHLIEACAVLAAEVLSAAGGLRVLATSREALRITGEHLYRVQPLPVPDPDAVQTAAAAVRFAGMELFAHRAAAVSPGFAVTSRNAPMVATICQLLDGVPLAIELAAARLRTLSLEQVAAGLNDRFRLLTDGDRTALPRQQTLHAAVQWSYELCAKPERLLWARASVFADRFTAAAAERVCSGDGLPADAVLATLSGLVDKSVLIAERDDDGLRYRLLDTVRQFGLDRLRHPNGDDCACGVHMIDEAVLCRRHRDFYLQLAERFHTDWFGPRQVEWTRRMRAEFANLRAALNFCVTNPDHAEAGVRLAGALYYFWYGCGEIREGRYWLQRALSADTRASRHRAWALAALARLHILHGLPEPATDLARQALRLARRFDEPFCVSHALHTLGLGITYTDDPARGRALLDDAVARAAELGPTHPARAFTTFALATWETLQGDPARADRLYAESRAISRAHSEQWWLGIVLTAAVVPALMLGDPAQARGYARESLHTRRALHDTHGAASSVQFLAYVAAAAHDYPRAARLLGAADRHWRAAGGSPFAAGAHRRIHEQYEAATRQALGDDAYDTEFRRGGELTIDEAAGYALGDRQAPATPADARQGNGPRLTRRQVEIAELVAQGLSNKQIADRLVISQRTVETHVENILAKFSFTSRAQVVAWYAQRQGRQPPSSAPTE
jgi:predicted ATPase/DNA-binding CsgD family transcriptional regulator